MWTQILAGGLAVVCFISLYVYFFSTAPLLAEVKALREGSITVTKALTAAQSTLELRERTAEAVVTRLRVRCEEYEAKYANCARQYLSVAVELPPTDGELAIPVEIHDDDSPTRRVHYEQSLQLAARAEIAEPTQEPDGRRLRRKRKACGLSRVDWSAMCDLSASDIQSYESGQLLLDTEQLVELERRLDSRIAELPLSDTSGIRHET